MKQYLVVEFPDSKNEEVIIFSLSFYVSVRLTIPFGYFIGFKVYCQKKENFTKHY